MRSYSEGVRGLIDDEPDMEVAGEASSAEQAPARGPALRPDVAVLDVRLPDGNGISVCREPRSRIRGLACLMLASSDDEKALLDAIVAGGDRRLCPQANQRLRPGRRGTDQS